MITIGVLSDTHLRKPDRGFEALVSRHFQGVDMVVHTGDMVTLDVLEPFMAMGKEVIAVCGNMDHDDVRRACPQSRIITVEDVRIGVIHGWGSPGGIRGRIRDSFRDVDAILYGHTHSAFSGTESGIFFFNPGSATDSRFTSPCSVGIIRIDKRMMQGDIIPV